MPNGYDPVDLTDVPPCQPQPDRDGTPLDLVFGGYWYGRNGPGILLRALALAGPDVATLTIIGGVSQPIAARFERLTGNPPRLEESRSRAELYQRLAHADASVIPIDHASATESRIPAKVYDCLFTTAMLVPWSIFCDRPASTVRACDQGRSPTARHASKRRRLWILCCARCW